MTISRADGTYVNKLTRLANLDVLVLDDFLISPLKDVECPGMVSVPPSVGAHPWY
ncbi:hypothetical protein DB30_05660 [Enhygromyxa salina]|uniref:Uncharacterized protein n=1 Tax=Enhygromyxa salina TaxID=215803 RepID=A0A0C1ZWA4_9BACT|nr:hypothetical protein [Enhygromyxa salina]KIG15328.1 hypothetical protein DB30_05660 [Enhygromyxa salina]